LDLASDQGRGVPLVVSRNISRIPLQQVNDNVNFKLQYTHQIHLNRFIASESSNDERIPFATYRFCTVIRSPDMEHGLSELFDVFPMSPYMASGSKDLFAFSRPVPK
jgi:hypothetical protein